MKYRNYLSRLPSSCTRHLPIITLFLALSASVQFSATQPVQRYIVQGADADIVTGLINDVGGVITHKLAIINAIGAILNDRQRDALLQKAQIREIYEDRIVESAKAHDGKKTANADLHPDYNFTTRVQADRLHNVDIDGKGVTVAFIDTGIHRNFKNLKEDADRERRLLAEYDAIKDKENTKSTDASGHGSHVVSIATSSE